MKADQVDKALCQKFLDDDERIVFWNDPEGEFVDYVSQGLPDELSAVTLRDVGVLGGLSTKLLLEREDRTGKYLLYSSQERPDCERGLATRCAPLQCGVPRGCGEPLA